MTHEDNLDWKLVIEGEFETLNPYINTERGNRFAAAKIKKTETERVRLFARLMPKIEKYPVIVHFEWYRANAKTDPDNVDFARKFILDGLVKAGVLKNDSCKEIGRLIADVYVSDVPCVVVTIKPANKKTIRV